MSLTRIMQLHRQGMDFDVALEESVLWKGSSKQKTTTESNQTSTPTQSAQYGDLLNKSTDWLNGGGLDQYYGGSAGYDTVANQNLMQREGLGAVNESAGRLAGLYNGAGVDTLSGYFRAWDPNNSELNNAIAASNKQLDYNYDTTVAPTIRQGATDTGQYGSTRHGVAEGIAQTGLATAKTNAASQLAYQDKQQWQQNQIGILNNLSGITGGLSSAGNTLYNAGSAYQQQEQNEINGGLERWAYENNVDLNNLIAYKNLISGDMGGTNMGTSTGTSKGGGGGGFMGMLGQVGGQFAGSAASSYGSKFGGSF